MKSIGIPADQIFRMRAEDDLEANAKSYEEMILKCCPDGMLDLVMLGMGDDGHTASLFPLTHALQVDDLLVVGNFVPQKQTWRMTLTYPGIHSSRNIALYVIGQGKAEKVKEVLSGPYDPVRLPSQAVGLPINKALWVLDKDAASLLARAIV